MTTFGIGNSGTCIIRAAAANQQMGDIISTYANEPYTIINGNFSLSFDGDNRSLNSLNTNLSYNSSILNEVRCSDVKLTDKILKLIFPKSEDNLITFVQYCDSDEENNIYLDFKGRDVIYQVFVYNGDSELEATYGELYSNVISVLQQNVTYQVVYSVVAEVSRSLDDKNQQYFTLDIQSAINDEDDSSICHIHIEKAAIQVSKNLSFNNKLNTIDLIFTVIKDYNHQSGENYIVIEK